MGATSRDESLVKPTNNRAKDWNGSEGGPDEVKIVTVLDNEAIFPKNKARCSWIDEFNTLYLEAHPPFYESQVSRYGDITCFEEHIVSASDQAVLRFDVSVNTFFFLSWIDKVNVFGVNSFPLLGRWTCLAIGLCEQLTKRVSIERGLDHESVLIAHLTSDAIITSR